MFIVVEEFSNGDSTTKFSVGQLYPPVANWAELDVFNLHIASLWLATQLCNNFFGVMLSANSTSINNVIIFCMVDDNFNSKNATTLQK